MRLPVRRWKAWCARGVPSIRNGGGEPGALALPFGCAQHQTGETLVARAGKNIGRPQRPPFFNLLGSLVLEHRDTVNVNRVPFNVPGHGNVMSIVILEGIGVVHR